MPSTLIENIGQKELPFNRTLRFNYIISKTLSLFDGWENSLHQKAVENLIFEVDNMGQVLYGAYKDADCLTQEQARRVLPQVQSIRKMITAQKNRFSTIGYANSPEARQIFHTLVRLANRLEARVQKHAYQNADQVPTPASIKEKMKANNRKAMANALR